MKQKIKIIVLLIFLCGSAVLFTRTGQMQTTQTQTLIAGQKFKNIKVLNDMPADQMGKVMNLMSASLGVNCNFCHVGYDFEKDGKEEKETAREMIRMTFELNKNYFGGRQEISCNTCHNGRAHPQSVPNLNLAKSEERPVQPKTLPTVEQVLDKYVSALGGRQNLEKITSRYIKANRVEPDGTIEPEEVWQKSPDKYLLVTKYPNYTVSEAFDGNQVWKRGNADEIVLKPDEIEQVKREAALFAPLRLAEIYQKMETVAVDKIDGREVYLVRATTAGILRERLYFDLQTGLLARRVASTPTVLGNFPYQVDYRDYKTFGAVKLPTTVCFAVPHVSWTRKVLDVKINQLIDDAKFAAPK